MSGWQRLGETKGWGRSRQDFYVQHERPKQLWVRELRKGARELLRARSLPASYAVVEQKAAPECEASVEELGASREYFKRVPDWRRKVGDYGCAGLVALVACASLCGVQRGQRDLAAFARCLSSQQLKALGFRKRGRPRRYRAPSETTFFRFLKGVDSVALERALLAWQEDRLGRRQADDNVLALDGKKLRSSQGVEVVSAYAVKSGRWLGSEMVQEQSNASKADCTSGSTSALWRTKAASAPPRPPSIWACSGAPASALPFTGSAGSEIGVWPPPTGSTRP